MAVGIFEAVPRAPKAFWGDTHRTRPPAETWEEWRGHAARFGITRIANLTGLDVIGIPVFTAIRPNSRSLATSQGKALEPIGARVSAFMEAVEFWHAERVRNPVTIESLQALRREGRVVADVERMHRYRAIDPALPRPWVVGFDLVRACECLVPLEAVSLNRVVAPGAVGDFQSSSNGLASGNHQLEAIVHGLCEVIERDASRLWQLSPEMRLVDLTKVEGTCREVVARIQAAGVHVAAWDTTSDVGVPTFTAVVIDHPETRLWRRLGVYYGVGTHLDPTVALFRALTEAVQSRVGFISGSRDDGFRSRYRQVTNDQYVADVWAAIRSSSPAVVMPELPSHEQDSFEGDLAVLLAALRRVSITSAIVVDLTREEIAVPVVKVIVPGLEGLGAGELPGERLRRASRLLAESSKRENAS